MTKDDTLKLALEAIEGVLDDSPKVLEASITGGLYEVVQCRDAITAIKEALAQPEQEPVAWYDIEHGEAETVWNKQRPPWEGRWKPLYTTPSQRKPLSEEEIGAILEDVNAYGTRLYTFARAIEAAHGIKGEA